MLRVKGIVNVVESEWPVIIHGVYHVFHEPQILQSWPDSKPITQIVLITRNLDFQNLKEALLTLNKEAGQNTSISA